MYYIRCVYILVAHLDEQEASQIDMRIPFSVSLYFRNYLIFDFPDKRFISKYILYMYICISVDFSQKI